MIIVGNVQKLHRFLPWHFFIEHCLKNGLVRKGDLNDEGIMERIYVLQNDEKSADEDDLEENIDEPKEEIKCDSNSWLSMMN